MQGLRLIATATIAASAALICALPAPAVTLDECITTAIRENPDAAAASARVAAAQAAARQARSAYYPWVNVSASYSRTDNAGQALFMLLNQRSLDFQGDLNNPDDTDNIRASISAQYRLLDFGRSSLDAGMARQGARAAGEMLAAVRNELVHEVTRGFHGILQAREFAKVQEESVASIDESLRIARERFAAGGTVKTDVLNLEVQLAQAREDLIRARNGLQLAVAALNTAVGADIATAETLVPAATDEPAPPPTGVDTTAVTNRPEYRAAAIMAGMGQDKLRRARRDYLPTVNAFASYDADNGDSDTETSYMAGVAVDLNVFDGFRTRGALHEARAMNSAASAELRKARNNLSLDLTQAHLAAKDAWERLDVSRRSLDSAVEALRITQEQYKQGAADISVLMTAQVGLTAMRTRKAAAYYDYLTALSNVDRAKGLLAARYAPARETRY